jgi:hypothetical protein
MEYVNGKVLDFSTISNRLKGLEDAEIIFVFRDNNQIYRLRNRIMVVGIVSIEEDCSLIDA